MSTTLPLFWHLSSNDKKERLDASAKLIGALEQFQAQFVPKASPETSDEEGDQSEDDADTLDKLNSQDVSYSIRRLVRGLASPRESSRLGFAVALTELLSRINTITCSQIVSLIMDSSKTQGSMTGQEERDMLFARLFGLTSVIQSGLIVRKTPLPASASSSTVASNSASYIEIVKQLIALGEKKTWLRESAWWTLGLAFEALSKSDVSWRDDALDMSLDIIYENRSWSPEKVAITVTLQDKYPEKDWRKYLSPTFKNPHILNTANYATLAKILKESSSDEDEESGLKSAAAGTWKAQVHYVWDIILDALVPPPESSKSPRGSLQEFFRIVVDDSLFAATSSAERKYWGFQIFEKALRRVDASDMPMLFTKHFMRCWINHLSKQDRYLHKVAKRVATEMQAIVHTNPRMGFTLILQLTGVHGSRQFDKLTKTKTVESILTSMDADGISSYIEYLLEHVNEEVTETLETDIQVVNSRRAWVVEQLSALVRNGAVPKQDDWLNTVLEWLAIHGLFEIKKKTDKTSYRALHKVPSPPLSEDLRKSCRARLLSCLSDLLTRPVPKDTDGVETRDSAMHANDGSFWIGRVLDIVTTLEKDEKHARPTVQLDNEDKELRDKALELTRTLDNAPEEQHGMAQGAKLLIQGTLVYQLCNFGEVDDDYAEALQVAEKKKERRSEAVDEDPPPIDIFVDAILGFLEEPSSYMRSLANQCFTLLCHFARDSTVDLILAQLERRDPTELLDHQGGHDTANEEEELDSNDDDHQSSEQEDSNEEEPDTVMRDKIEAVLSASGIQPAAEGSEDESEELMDDDQMMAIDEQLAAVFKNRATEAKKGKGELEHTRKTLRALMSKDLNAQREATHFKTRVLDLVDILVKSNRASPFIPRLIMSLLELISGCSKDEKHLADKAGGILRTRIGKMKEIPTQVDVEATVKLLESVHYRARRARSGDILTAFSQSSVYLTRILLHHGARKATQTVYKESLADFVTRKASCLNIQFFQDFICHYPAVAWGLRNDMLELTQKAVNSYRRCQVYLLLQGLLVQIPVQVNTISSSRLCGVA
ncbi:hypothetical protein GLOTRDRAFT_35678 [Gloeophyllum trabeum ATCC 11539]|uniref:DNA polymerase V n=1 Tax=Gloeophyllum trabeum (strain ATCC 11539 / FP-39264 / Madison 617) TaxID=670483 RepID=S7QHG9_GLOTA|nr:uncharacterized protein GLOTRDRAFT_35678 [Gloeophyllum trabeum ATCC 11539]EPQ58607.1 hypothetical protein GLOTRDRAFT_35678 [Gloeophyllum trabeum ATCC 11539]